jgi:hypothetical protein
MKDHDRAKAKPFLIHREDEGDYRLVVRETRYNSQNYPIVTATAVAESFKSAAAARAHAKANFGAQPGEFATK